MAGPTRGVTIVIAFALLISVFAVRVYAPSMPIATPNSLSYKLTSKLVKHSPYTELIMVACHSTLMGIDHTDIDNEENWSLAEMQRGQLKTYIEHIEKGVELAAANPHAILMFSGGQTRVEAGPRSEAYSYWVAAEAKNWWGHPEVKNRTVVEEFARDSMENVLFSLCRFREVHSAYPRFLTVVSYSYKKKRFTDLHRAAVAWPLDKYHFVGVDPEVNPYNDQMNIDKFTNDPYGCEAKSQELRNRRDHYKRVPPYVLACPEMGTLLRTCSKTPLPPSSVPWE